MDSSASKGTAERVKHILKAMENSIDAVRRKRLGVASQPQHGTGMTGGGMGQAIGGAVGIRGSGVAGGCSMPAQHGRTGTEATYGQASHSQNYAGSGLNNTIGRPSNANEQTIGRSSAGEAARTAYPFARANGMGGPNANASQQPGVGNGHAQSANGQGTTPAPAMRLKARPKRLDPSQVKDFPSGTYRSQAG